jgi:hypothetical protein
MWYFLIKVLHNIYAVLIKNEAVYLFYLVPITYFMTIVARLIYYKLKYHVQIYFRDVISVATMMVIFLDYLNYLYLLVTGTGQVLPFRVFLIKYTIGFLLWGWMFWYSYKIHLRNSIQGQKAYLKKKQAVLVCFCSMFIILLIIGIVLS